MEFRVLGPLEVADHGLIVDLGSPRIRLVCGLLLVRPGELVAIDRFVDELWPERPPSDARSLVRGYVSRLRRALRCGPDGADRLATRKPGYLLRVADGEVDAQWFERLATEARAAVRAGEPARGVELFDQAHALWRGEPFADVPHTVGLDRGGSKHALVHDRFGVLGSPAGKDHRRVLAESSVQLVYCLLEHWLRQLVNPVDDRDDQAVPHQFPNPVAGQVMPPALVLLTNTAGEPYIEVLLGRVP